MPVVIRVFVALACAKIVLGLGAGVTELIAVPFTNAKDLLQLATTIAFAAAGALLVGGGRRDDRAATLGTVFLLVASVFADQLGVPLRDRTSPLLTAVRAVLAIQVDAFTPYFVWRFVGEFPRALQTSRARAWIVRAERASLAVGAVLLLANAVEFLLAGADDGAGSPTWLHPLQRDTLGGLYWPAQLLLLAPALPALLLKTRRAPADERRRTELLAVGLLVGTMPTLLWVLWSEAVPGVRRVLPLSVAGWVIWPTLLATPFATAYAVLVRRALDVRVIIRRAIRYAITRYSVLVLLAAPLLALVVALYRGRDATVAEIVASPVGIALAVLTALALGGLVARERILRRVDRHFFRERYDARRVIGRLVEGSGRATGPADLAAVVRAEVAAALHPDGVHVLLRDGRTGDLVAPDAGVRPLRGTAPLAAWLARPEALLDVDPELTAPAVAALPDDDRHWLADAGVRLLIPIPSGDQDGRLHGLLALGERRSELPYGTQDRDLLREVARVTAMAVAARFPGRAGSEEMVIAEDQPADECRRCGAVQRAGSARCSGCDAVPAPAVVPQTIARKFVVDRRLGAGGMGVVYHALDLQLGREVAIKTLPVVSPQQAVWLRREARAMAAVLHPNLALIFGAETWRGQPMLVVEYLAGGTLAELLREGPLPIHEALDLAAGVAAGLAAIHRAGVLHGDVKPSNIGFAADGTPKLLDFGLARLVPGRAARGAGHEAPARPSHAAVPGPGYSPPHADGTASSSTTFGTPHYMSPEARAGLLPTPGFDVWSLCITLLESIGEAVPGTGDRTTGAHRTIPSLQEPPSSADPAHGLLAEFFQKALGPSPALRPQTAEQLRAQLLRLRADLTERASDEVERGRPSGIA